MKNSDCRIQRRVLSLVAPLTLLVAACAKEAPRAAATVADTSAAKAAVSVRDDLLLAAAKVALPPPGVKLADLPNPNSQQAQHLVTYCTSCHDLPSPSLHSATDWPTVVRRMWLRMDRLPTSFNVPVPDPAVRVVMLQYLIDNSLKVSGANLPAGEFKPLFETTCSRCHDLPDPKQHSAGDWLAVVERMSVRAGQMLGQRIDQADVNRIALYLEGVTKQQKRK